MPELEVWLCLVHSNLDESGKLEPLDNCVACLQAERDELRAKLAAAEVRERGLRERLTGAVETLQRIHKGACFTASESISRDEDRYCIAEIITESASFLCNPLTDAALAQPAERTEGERTDTERLAYLADPMKASIELYQDLLKNTSNIEEFRKRIDAEMEASRAPR